MGDAEHAGARLQRCGVLSFADRSVGLGEQAPGHLDVRAVLADRPDVIDG
jgi:hypothetical protein